VLKVNVDVNIKFAKGKQTVKTGIQKVAGLNIYVHFEMSIFQNIQ